MKDLYKVNQDKKATKNQINDSLIEQRKSVIRREIYKNENPKKIISYAQNILDFIKQQNVRGLKILTLNQMLQRLLIGFTQVKTSNIFDIL